MDKAGKKAHQNEEYEFQASLQNLQSLQEEETKEETKTHDFIDTHDEDETKSDDEEEKKENVISNKIEEVNSILEELKITEEEKTRDDNDIRIAVIGNVDSGKSTLVGVLTKGLLDDGRGAARLKVFNFTHEAQNGRTSSIGQEIMGFNQKHEQIEPERSSENKNKQWAHITKEASKIITFLDLCGHEKYLKTTIFGLVGCLPDYSLIVVGANMGVSRMTKEHLGISLALKVPIFIVVTKIDMCPENVYKDTINTLTKILRSPGASRLPVVVGEKDDVSAYSAALASDRICPIFPISNVTGLGVPKLKEFLGLLSSRTAISGQFAKATDPVEFLIDGVYSVTGVGIVAAGTMKAGTVVPNQSLTLGPDKEGKFKKVVVRTIHHKRVAVDKAIAGMSACFNIKIQGKKDQLRKKDFRKGMVLVDDKLNPKSAWEFDAEVVILHHATTIKTNYQAVIHCGVIRQAAQVLNMSKDLLRTGDKGLIRFKFMYRPEYLHKGMTILFREGRTKGLGVIANIDYEAK